MIQHFSGLAVSKMEGTKRMFLMMKLFRFLTIFLLLLGVSANFAIAGKQNLTQVGKGTLSSAEKIPEKAIPVARERPAEWKNLVPGGQFIRPLA